MWSFSYSVLWKLDHFFLPPCPNKNCKILNPVLWNTIIAQFRCKEMGMCEDCSPCHPVTLLSRPALALLSCAHAVVLGSDCWASLSHFDPVCPPITLSIFVVFVCVVVLFFFCVRFWGITQTSFPSAHWRHVSYSTGSLHSLSATLLRFFFYFFLMFQQMVGGSPCWQTPSEDAVGWDLFAQLSLSAFLFSSLYCKREIRGLSPFAPIWIPSVAMWRV